MFVSSVAWIVARHVEDAPWRRGDAKSLFHPARSPGLFKTFGIHEDLAFDTDKLLPTIILQQALATALRQHSPTNGSRLPAQTFVPMTNRSSTFNLGFRTLPPSTLIAEASLTNVNAELAPSDVIRLQDINSLEPVCHALRRGFSLITGKTPWRDPLWAKPAIHVLVDANDVAADVTAHEREYVASLIRNETFDGMDHRICRVMMTKNAQHNVKSVHERLLIDKQGIMFVTKRGVSDHRLGSTTKLVEIAMGLSLLLEHYRSWSRASPESARAALDRVGTWIRSPNAVFRKSVTHREEWALLNTEYSLPDLYGAVRDF